MITKSDLDTWKRDPITKAIFERLEELRDGCNDSVLNGELLLKPEGHLKVNRLIGVREGIDLILSIEEDNEEES